MWKQVVPMALFLAAWGPGLAALGETVPAMERLMERQEQGWAYIKP